MAGYVIRRVGMGVLTLLGATMLVFLLMNVLPGDVVRISLGGEYGGAAVDEKTLNKIRHDLGLDRPLAVQYVDWLRKLVTGKMGYSYAEKSDVGPLIGRRISPTMHRGIQAVVFSWLFGLPLGLFRRSAGTPSWTMPAACSPLQGFPCPPSGWP